MDDTQMKYQYEEPFLIQEIILGMVTAIGIFLMAVSEIPGMLVVLLGVLSVAGIYLYRIYKALRNRGEVVSCCFAFYNNASMIVAVAGILLLMLMNVHHRLIFFIVLALLFIAFILNILFRGSKEDVSEQLLVHVRFLVAGVLLLVFFLL